MTHLCWEHYSVHLIHFKVEKMDSIKVMCGYIAAGTHMYVVSGSRQRMISEIDERGSWMSPSITHGDLAPDMMSSTKLNIVSVKRRKLSLAHTHKDVHTNKFTRPKYKNILISHAGF